MHSTYFVITCIAYNFSQEGVYNKQELMLDAIMNYLL